jgi:hypothetical protein
MLARMTRLTQRSGGANTSLFEDQKGFFKLIQF